MSNEGGWSSEEREWMRLGRAKVDGARKSDEVQMELERATRCGWRSKE